MIKALNCASALLLATAACSHPAASASATPGAGATKDHHAQLLAEAMYEYTLTREVKALDRPGATIGHGTPVPAVQVSAWEMHKIRPSTPEKHHWVGAFFVDGQYDGLGFGSGLNYVFRLDSDDPTRTYVVVPSNTALPPRYLSYDPTIDLTGGHADPPLAIRAKISSPLKADEYTIGGCVEGPCGSGHCSVTDAGAEYTGV